MIKGCKRERKRRLVDRTKIRPLGGSVIFSEIGVRAVFKGN